ncbi:MAG: FtsX-like permease family protein [Candidatus Thorarchaeota archaeon]
MASFIEHFKLNLKFIGFSKRLAIITIVGLSISIAMVTQNILFLNSFRNNAYNEFAANTTDTYIEANMNHVGTYGFNIISMIASSVNSELEDLDIDSELYNQEWVTYKDFYLMLFNEKYHENEFHNTYLIGVSTSYLELLSPLITIGDTPDNGEKIIITNTQTLDETDLAIGIDFEGYVPVDDSGNPWSSYAMGLGQAGTLFEFTGIINIDEVSFGSVTLPDELQAIVSIILRLGSEVILTDIATCISIVHSITFSQNDISIYGRIMFDLPAFDVFQLDDTIDQLQIFVNRLQENLIEIIEVFSSNYELDLNSKIVPLLANFRQEFRIFQIFLMVFMLPTLGMSLALTAFATNQVKKQRDLHVNNLHQRGASRNMLFRFMLFELVIYALLAVIVGFFIGWPYTLVAMKSDGFFSFGNTVEIPALNWIVIVICVGAGFLIAFLSNIFTVWRRAKTTIEEALQEQSEKAPFWERFYIDIFILILGIIMWIVASTQISGGGATAVEFAFYFAAPAPFLVISGSIMLITRIYPTIIRFISNLLFKIPRLEINAIAARNAIRRRVSTSRTIILMTLTFTLTVGSMIIPDSYRAYDLENSYYGLGADIIVNDVDITTPNYKESVIAIEGVEAVTYVGILDLTNTESDLLYRIKIMGVELDNFSKVAFEEPEYTDNRMIENVLKSIKNPSDVIGQKDQIDLLSLGDNSTFVIKNWAVVGPDVVEQSYPVNITDYYNYWPRLFTVKPEATSKEMFIGLLANITLPFTIARNEYDVEGKLFVKVQEGYSIIDVAREIELTTRHETDNVEELLLISEGTLKSTVLFGALNSSFIVSMLISAATLITMMLIQAIEREKELAVMKSMGISPRQLFSFFITEAIIMLSFTMILGIILGIGSSVMIMKIFRIGSIYPPHENIFPVVKILLTTVAVFVSGLISTIIPIIINTRKKMVGALKAL